MSCFFCARKTRFERALVFLFLSVLFLPGRYSPNLRCDPGTVSCSAPETRPTLCGNRPLPSLPCPQMRTPGDPPPPPGDPPYPRETPPHRESLEDLLAFETFERGKNTKKENSFLTYGGNGVQHMGKRACVGESKKRLRPSCAAYASAVARKASSPTALTRSSLSRWSFASFSESCRAASPSRLTAAEPPRMMSSRACEQDENNSRRKK